MRDRDRHATERFCEDFGRSNVDSFAYGAKARRIGFPCPTTFHYLSVSAHGAPAHREQPINRIDELLPWNLASAPAEELRRAARRPRLLSCDAGIVGTTSCTNFLP